MRRLMLGCFIFSMLIVEGYAKTFTIHQWETKNGTRVAFYQAMEIPMLNLTLAFAAGSAYDGKKFGLSRLTTQLLNQGNAQDDANAIADRFASIGTQYQSDTTRDMVILNLRTLSEETPLNESIKLLNHVVKRPSFPEEAFQREKNIQRTIIAHSQERPNDVADHAFFKALYAEHPYAHPIIGEEASLKVITQNDVKQFYNRYFVASNAVMVMVGAVSLQKAHQIAEQTLQDIEKGHPAELIPTASLNSTTVNPIAIPFSSTQSVLRLGQVGINYQCKDYFPLLVGNYILGGGDLVSRLSQEIREKRGLTYGVNSQFAPMLGLGPFIISLATQAQQAQEAMELAKQTVSKFITDGASEEELLAAKRHLTGSFALSLASNSQISARLLQILFYHLPNNYLTSYESNINQVSLSAIQQAFKQQLHPDTMRQIFVGNS